MSREYILEFVNTEVMLFCVGGWKLVSLIKGKAWSKGFSITVGGGRYLELW